MSSIRDEVLDELAQFIRKAEDEGQSSFEAIESAQRAFPGTPDMVLYEASARADSQRTEEWWGQVERTIEGEVITRAIGTVGGRK